MIEYKDLGKFYSYKHFIEGGSFYILIETIESFFNCTLNIYPHPLSQIKKNFNIDILDNPRRGYYPIDENNVVIIARVIQQKQMVAAIGFLLTGDRIGENVKLLNKFEGAISATFTQEFNNFYQNGTLAFGDELIKHTITNYLCQGFYDFRNIRHLIEYFFKLRTTSFEGSFFSTGLILTKAFHDFLAETRKNRFGETFDLKNWMRLKSSNKINKRFWYLADGKKSFFLGTKNLDLTNLFVLDEEYVSTNYIDNHSLSLTLRGGDLLFKVENEKLFSINTSTGFEFLFFENQWKFRNYNFLKKIISENITTDKLLIDTITFYLLSCSKKQISSILWFPEKIEAIDDFIQINTKNNFIKESINISDKRFINHIFRCLSSDGASIISNDGTFLHFGVIIDISKITVSGLKGTGESAASALSSNGISIKISQDGNIKIFLEYGKDPLSF